ncbi:MAG: hypothetical protein QG597_2896 [Actinomycetota bacterium]|nr:hypothetical protein [Actinomycetota bacterium]
MLSSTVIAANTRSIAGTSDTKNAGSAVTAPTMIAADATRTAALFPPGPGQHDGHDGHQPKGRTES